MTKKDIMETKMHLLADIVGGHLRTILSLTSESDEYLTLEQRERMHMVVADMTELALYLDSKNSENEETN